MIATIIESEQTDGVCFFCGNYADSIKTHEMNVHGKRDQQLELY